MAYLHTIITSETVRHLKIIKTVCMWLNNKALVVQFTFKGFSGRLDAGRLPPSKVPC